MKFQVGGVSTENSESSSRTIAARTAENNALVENDYPKQDGIMISELPHDLYLLHGTLITIIQNLSLTNCMWAASLEH
jgi:hypothetical protein